MPSFACPNCTTLVNLSGDFAGKSVRCPSCHVTFKPKVSKVAKSADDENPAGVDKPLFGRVWTLRNFGIAVFACGLFLVVLSKCNNGVFKKIGTIFNAYPYVTDEDMAIMKQGKGGLNGKTLIFPCRFGGVYRESADGYAVHFILDDGGRIAAWISREGDHPAMEYGDLVYATLSFSESSTVAIRVRKQ